MRSNKDTPDCHWPAKWLSLLALMSICLNLLPVSQTLEASQSPNPTCSMHSEKTVDRMVASKTPPGGHPADKVPQFIVLTFDDNPDIEAMSWMMDTARTRANPDGSRIPLTFFSNGKYLDESPDLATLHLQAWKEGHEIGNHTLNHPGGENFSAEEWQAEIKLCTAAFVNAGIPEHAITGFRAPFIAYNAATFAALDALDYHYDSSIEEGFEQEMDGSNGYWPYTMDNGSPGNVIAVEQENREAVGRHKGLWQLPVHALIVPSDDMCAEYGVAPGLRERIRENIKRDHDWEWPSAQGKITGYDWNLLEMGSVSGDEFLAILKHSFDLKITGNRAPIVFGGHTALYPAAPIDRRKAMAAFIDYALEHDDVRFVTPTALIDWMNNPQTIE
ncbi:MAG: polysaccharide deacetylase family protein [Puniceicoccaceae bacterium]